MKLIKNSIICFIFVLSCIMTAACSKGNKPVLSSASKGEGKGRVEFSGSEPVITLYDIVAKVGTDIDYTSKIDIEKEENCDNFEVWVNASDVDIYEPGTYKAVYTFYYNDKSVSKEINVTIVENYSDGPEVSAGIPDSTNVLQNENNNTAPANPDVPSGSNQTNLNNINSNNTTKPVKPTDSPNTAGSVNTTGSTAAAQPDTTARQPDGTTRPMDTAKPVNPTSPINPTVSINPTKPADTTGPTAGSPGETTTVRTFIPAADREKDTTSKDLGYMNIELLSGSTVRVKCTTSRYIVSTRTEVSEVTRKGVKYQVSKLVVKFNTGTEQILETSEKRIG